jgi:hypothetical protein
MIWFQLGVLGDATTPGSSNYAALRSGPPTPDRASSFENPLERWRPCTVPRWTPLGFGGSLRP